MSAQMLPETAPFSMSQRAWLNGFFAGLVSGGTPAAAPAQPAAAEEEFPWHDASVPLDDRMKLAAGKPPARVLMAAMAQLDCGSCGYVCKTYAEAIADGTEKDLSKCSPGGKDTLRKLKEIAATLTISAQPASIAPAKSQAAGVVSREHPHPAPLIRSIRLNAAGSQKEVRHVEISLKGSGLQYKVGDALGVWPENCVELVGGVIDRLGATGAEDARSMDGTHTSLYDALLRERILTTPTEQLIELLITTAEDKSESRRLQAMLIDEGGEPLEGLHVLDILELVPSARPGVEDFVNSLGKLRPRLYSISSSPRAHVDQVHLTVGAVRYTSRSGRAAKGVASTYLADRVRPGAKVRVFLHASQHFGLPASGDTPIIMVGPGTGIAPFRAFLHDRRAAGATGGNWLFFGDQRQAHDFLYREELEQMLAERSLHRLSTAFSRDSSEKVYVQHRMAQHGAELWQWLSDGAHFYVCGDAGRMARDVDATLKSIVADHGGMSDDAAADYVADMSRKGRYQRDVY